ncbi:MAG: SufD family Fe-S cluster assembly protein, partial [Opitutales bacterium]
LGTVHTRQNAVVKRVYVQDHRPGMQCYQSEEATAERDVSLQSTAINIGASYARLEGATIAAGSGADVHLYSMGAPTGTQVFDQRTLQVHRASHARSDLLFKNALLDKSQTIFSGMIVVEDEAQQTDAYQTNNNLLLSPTAEANSLPGLEIEANDVKCSHGATSGQVDSEQLFYLKARGIPERQAYELLVFGFFEEVLGKIASDDVHEKLADKVKAKFEA